MPDTRKERKKRQAAAGKANAEHKAKARKRKKSSYSKKEIKQQILDQREKRKRTPQPPNQTKDDEFLKVIGRTPSRDVDAIQKLKQVLLKTKLFRVCTKQHAKRTNGMEYLALRRLCADVCCWKQSPLDWNCKSKNAWSQLKSLIDHLCGKYPMPDWSYNMWVSTFMGDKLLWISMASGINIRKLNHNYILTKRMAHLITEAPRNSTFPEAIRYAQMKANNLSKHMISEVLKSRHFDEERIREYVLTKDVVTSSGVGFREQFKVEFFTWLGNQGMFDPREIINVIDYIWSKDLRVYSLQGRTATSVLRACHEWHEAQARDQQAIARQIQANRHLYAMDKPPPTQWEQRFEPWERGTPKKCNHWTANNITTLKMLKEEGKAMHHCVGSYAYSCASGSSIIISFRFNGIRQFTIEVNGHKFTQVPIVRQKRACSNRALSNEMENALERWIRDVKRTVPKIGN